MKVTVDIQPEFEIEIKEVKTPEEKVMLLQKYGMMEPKLTPDEQFMIADEIALKLHCWEESDGTN